ncbi:MAG: TrkA C-terminal domain-containing protein [Clostridia bacterium]|nr:TrkA C-terminal domain-containing protein [Clostridia bacterium]
MWGKRKEQKNILIVGDCQVTIALTGSDESNLVICEMCKQFFHVKKTVALLNDPSKTNFFYQMGIDRVVCALNMITNIMEEQAVLDEMTKLIPVDEGRIQILELPIPKNSSVAGKKLWELNLPKEVIIGCILRGDQSLIPRGDTRITEGDVLLIITSDESKLDQIKELTEYAAS